jgi:hypothetical protein
LPRPGLFGALVHPRLPLETRRNLPRLDGAIIGLAGLFACLRRGAAAGALSPGGNSYVAHRRHVFDRCRRWPACAAGAPGQPGARIFLLAWTALLVGVVVVGLRNLNLLPTTFFSFYAIQIGSAIEMVLLSFALAETHQRPAAREGCGAGRGPRPPGRS